MAFDENHGSGDFTVISLFPWLSTVPTHGLGDGLMASATASWPQWWPQWWPNGLSWQWEWQWL